MGRQTNLFALKSSSRRLGRVLYLNFAGVVGWQYHDAEMSDGDVYEPWNWVKKVGKALFHALPADFAGGKEV